MKKINLLNAIVATVFLGIACNPLSIPDPNATVNEDQAPPQYVPYSAEYIEVPEGSEVLVYIDNILVATCYESGYVVLPKAAARTRALSDYQIVTVPSSGTHTAASENELEMVVAFEDTKQGDHDYNDLVIQSHIVISNSSSGSSTVKLDITPVAMGASLRLGLGVVLTDVSGNVLADQQITGDCRNFLFNGDSGFINTLQQNRKVYDTVSLTVNSTGGAVAGLSWYLLSKDQKLFASNYFQACLDDSEKPQGLVFMQIRDDIFFTKNGNSKSYCGNNFWQYPVESVSIGEVYPDFDRMFLNGGDFTALATPSGKFYDSIAADSDGLLSRNCLYNVYRTGSVIVEPESVTPDSPAVINAELYYGLGGNSYTTPQPMDAIYNIFNHSEDNFILEFSTALDNAVDFARGDVIEGKATSGGDYMFDIGELNPDAAGKALEFYANGNRDWFRIQDAHNHESTYEKGKSFPLPVEFRISKAGGIEVKINGQYEQRLAPTNEVLAHILTLGTTRPLYFGLFGNFYSAVHYEYVKVIRNVTDGPVSRIHVSSVSVEDGAVLNGSKITLSATVLPSDASNKALNWTSSDTSIASVNPTTGEVEGIAEGQCTITATSVSDPTVSGSCTVTVTATRDEVLIWSDHVASTTALDSKTLKIIASGTPANDEICFSNGDYLQVKLHRTEVLDKDHDVFYLGSQSSGKTPYICVIGHPASTSELYVIPSSWWSVSNLLNTGKDVAVYYRFGCKADGTKGCGAYSTDGLNWTSFSNSNDFEAEWQKMTDPSRSPLIIQNGRNTGSLQAVTYDYVKIIRNSAR